MSDLFFTHNKDGDIVLTDERKEFVKVVYTVAGLTQSQKSVLKDIEKAWDVKIVAYERKA